MANTRRVKSARDRVLDNIKPTDMGYKVDGEPSKCWLWQGETDRDGYGKIKHEGRYTPVHWVLKGDARNDYYPPEGLEGDHLCKQRQCCRPSHIEWVTRQENLRRMHRDRKNKDE